MIQALKDNWKIRCTRFDFPEEEVELRKSLTFKVPNYWFSRAYKQHAWDGTTTFYNGYSRTFPTGLFHILPRVIQEHFHLVDQRTKPVCSVKPLRLHGVELREYQLDAIEKAVVAERAIITAPTNAGKTELGCGLMQMLPCRTLWLTHRGNLLYQTAERIEKRLVETPVIVGGGKGGSGIEVARITVGMVQTIYAALKSLDAKVKSDWAIWLNSFDMLIVDECLDGETHIAVPEGFKLLRELRVGDLVVTPTGQARVKRIWKVVKSAFKFVLGPGSYLIGSADHLVPSIENRGLKEVRLDVAKTLLVPRKILRRLPYEADEYMLGWILGDGHRRKNTITFGFRKDIERITEIFSPFPIRRAVNAFATCFTLSNAYSRILLSKFAIPEGDKAGIVEIPDELYRKCSVGVIKGLFDAEGYRGDGNRIGLDMKSERCVSQLSDMLKSYGVWNTVSRLRRTTQPQYEDRFRLLICGENINLFNQLIGFEIERKQGRGYKSRVSARSLYKAVSIKRVEPLGERELYDFEIDDDFHLFYANGILSFQCHHQAAGSWYKIANKCGAYYRFGLSATPLRNSEISNMKLIAVTGEEIKTVSNRDLIDAGHSAKPVIYRVKNECLPFIKTHSYRASYRMGIVQNQSRNQIIAKLMRAHAMSQEPTLVLVVEVEHGKRICDLFGSLGQGAAQFVDGSVGYEERNRYLRDLEAGVIPAIVSTAIFDEGADVPNIRVLVLAGGGASPIQLLQRLGRGMRKKQDGENKVVVYDFEDGADRFLSKHSLSRYQLYLEEGFEVIPLQVEDSNESAGTQGV